MVKLGGRRLTDNFASRELGNVFVAGEGTVMASFRCLLALLGIGVLAGVVAVAAEPSEITAKVVDRAGFDRAVAEHKGKVVLVDCWATWCVPCLRAFPKTVELHRQFQKDGLVVMSLNFDDLDAGKPSPKVLSFLKKHEAAFPNLVSALDIGGDGAEAFGIPDGALPHFFLYGRDGKLLKVFTSSDPDQTFSHAELEAAVAAALRE